VFEAVVAANQSPDLRRLTVQRYAHIFFVHGIPQKNIFESGKYGHGFLSFVDCGSGVAQTGIGFADQAGNLWSVNM
jgi:hypothetical protein